jgi:hypothetical protein
MSDILLQAIVEKLESFEIGFLKGNSDINAMQQGLTKEIKPLQSQIAQLSLQFSTVSEKISGSLKSIAASNFQLEGPAVEQIKHSHHLHKGIWFAIGLFILSLLFLYGWINCNNAKNAFEANDIKYRYLKVNGNSNLLKAAYYTDSLYKINKDYFAKQVIAKKQILVEQAEQFRLAGEKKKEVRNIKAKVVK